MWVLYTCLSWKKAYPLHCMNDVTCRDMRWGNLPGLGLVSSDDLWESDIIPFVSACKCWNIKQKLRWTGHKCWVISSWVTL